MKIRVTSQYNVSGASDLDKVTDLLMAELLKAEHGRPSISEADVTAVLTKNVVTLSLVVDDGTWRDADEQARAVITQAIENIGGAVAGTERNVAAPAAGILASKRQTELLPA